MSGTVYLLHFEPAYKHARHYLGFTPGDVEDRVRDHVCGRGARLVEVAVNAGCSIQLARTWTGGRTTERQLKRIGGASRICPICSPGTRWGATPGRRTR